MDGPQKLNRKIRQIRGKLTQKQFAKALQVSQGTIAKYETGQSTPKAKTVFRLAEFSGSPVESLLDNNPNEENNFILLSNDEIELVTAFREIVKNEPDVYSFALPVTRKVAKSIKNLRPEFRREKMLDELRRSLSRSYFNET